MGNNDHINCGFYHGYIVVSDPTAEISTKILDAWLKNKTFKSTKFKNLKKNLNTFFPFWPIFQEVYNNCSQLWVQVME